MAREKTRPIPINLPTKVGQRPERADAARNRRILLEAAARILHKEGIAALSMEAVAAEAGVGIGTVYRRFRDRSGLAFALLDGEERDLQEAVLSGPPPLGPGAPAEDRLRAFIHAYVDRLNRQAELLAVAELGPERRYSDAYAFWRRHLETLIEAIDPHLDARYLAEAILAALSAQHYIHQTIDEGMPDDRIRSGLEQLVGGIIPRR